MLVGDAESLGQSFNASNERSFTYENTSIPLIFPRSLADIDVRVVECITLLFCFPYVRYTNPERLSSAIQDSYRFWK